MPAHLSSLFITNYTSALMKKNEKITQVSAVPACPSSLLITHCTDVFVFADSVSVNDFTFTIPFLYANLPKTDPTGLANTQGIFFLEDVIVNKKYCQFNSYMIFFNFGTTPYYQGL